MKYKVSIIIPIYNSEKYLNRCLNSIKEQTYKNIEAILINDGSTDSSKEICDSFVKNNNIFHLYNLKNNGPSAARNFGLKKATGDYIVFVDSDDFIDGNFVEKLTMSLNQSVDLAICGYRREYISKREINIEDVHITSTGLYTPNTFLNLFWKFNKDGITNSLWNKIYKRALINENNIAFNEKIRIGEDLLFNLDYFQVADRILLIDDILYNYNALDENSLTRSYKANLFQNQKKLIRKVESILKDYKSLNYKNRKRMYQLYENTIILSIENIFNYNNDLSLLIQLQKVKAILNDSNTIETIKNARENNPVSKDIIAISTNNLLLIYIYFKCKYLIKKVSLSQVHKDSSN